MVQKQTQKCALQSVTCGRFHLRNSMRPQNTATSYLKKKASKQATTPIDFEFSADFTHLFRCYTQTHTSTTHFDLKKAHDSRLNAHSYATVDSQPLLEMNALVSKKTNHGFSQPMNIYYNEIYTNIIQ